MKNLSLAAACIVSAMPFSGLAQAADAVVVERSRAAPPIYRADRYSRSDTDLYVERREGPVVYGWSFRPPNCGVFHYWNGEECIDARVLPPSLNE